VCTLYIEDFIKTLTIDLGFASVNSQGRGGNKLAITEYTVYKYFIIPKNIRDTISIKIQYSQLSENSALFNKLSHITIRRYIFLQLTVWNFIDLVPGH
jgi:hypothetical protein